MKITPVLFGAACLALPVAAVSRLAAEPVQGPPDANFKTQFQKLATQKNKDEMAKLVKSRLEDAIAWVTWTCEQIAAKPSDEHEAFMADLREAWTAGVKSTFADKEYEYFKNIGTHRKDRNDLKSRMEKAATEFRDNLDKKDGFVYQNLVDEFDAIAAGFEQEGDFFEASQTWILGARSYDEELRGSGADLHKACVDWTHAVECRDKVDLKDQAYEDALKRKNALVAKGFDKKAGPVAKPADEPPPKPAADAGAPVTVKLGFEVVGSIDEFLRPNYLCDEIDILWEPIPIKAKGNCATLQRLDGAPLFCRVGPSDLRVDSNGDGTGDDKVALTGNIAPIKITLGKGDKASPYAILGQVGTDREEFQGIQINLQPADDRYTIYALAAASVVGTINGIPVRVIDESLDGTYGGQPKTWRYQGLSKDMAQPDLDSIVIGASKRARPWSEYQQIGDKWFKLETVSPNGQELKATPASVETGTLKLDYKGPAPTWVIVKGSNDTKDSYFDLVEGGAKGVEVPVGKYSLAYGEVRKGKKKLVQKAVILPGKRMNGWEVKKGATTLVTLGAPYGFDFQPTFQDGKLSVKGSSVFIVGAQGERYERMWDCVPHPEVIWRKKGSKTPSKGDRMPFVQDSAAFEKLGWEATWTPLDLDLTLKNEKGPVEVQLVEKKHELFGKIESDWKE
jgi:hypothetical protein